MTSVVFDTVILVRGLINPFSRCGRIVFDHSRAYELVVSPAIVQEYETVLVRPELTRKYRAVATRDLRTTLDIVAAADVVQPPDTPTICRDPADDKFLAAAKSGNAQFLVTEDADLLDMETYENTAIVTAEAFLRILESIQPLPNPANNGG